MSNNHQHTPTCPKCGEPLTTSTEDVGESAYVACADCGALLDRIGPAGAMLEDFGGQS